MKLKQSYLLALAKFMASSHDINVDHVLEYKNISN